LLFFPRLGCASQGNCVLNTVTGGGNWLHVYENTRPIFSGRENIGQVTRFQEPSFVGLITAKKGGKSGNLMLLPEGGFDRGQVLTGYFGFVQVGVDLQHGAEMLARGRVSLDGAVLFSFFSEREG
jgi:hypothetical protein